MGFCDVYSDFMGFYSDFMGFWDGLVGLHGDLVGSYGKLMGFTVIEWAGPSDRLDDGFLWDLMVVFMGF